MGFTTVLWDSPNPSLPLAGGLVGRGSVSLTEAVKGDEGRHGSMGPSSSPVSRFLLKFQVLGLGTHMRAHVRVSCTLTGERWA